MWKLVLPMIGLVLLSLWLAFRRFAEVLLSLAVLFVSGLCLLAVMRIMGWSWNLLNLMALPLILGTGVDYSLFMQLALRRHHGNLEEAHRSVGRALLLCGGTAVSGFGSLGLSSNAGMAGLGQVCAVGIAANVLLAVYLLPVWWKRFSQGSADGRAMPNNPSSLYSARLWSVALTLTRLFPPALTAALARIAAATYWRLAAHRREIVILNLLPVFNGDRKSAEAAAKKLFQDFAQKLIDLWRYEGGGEVDAQNPDWLGWEIFTAAHARGKGVLIVTPHLGNWEFGALFFVRRGIPMLVLTQAEPDARLTEIRLASRARRGVETLVIGEDMFAFVEIIKRLQAGATVALLVDRPPPATAVAVELFGERFQGSTAAAELARASGCAIIPGFVARKPGGYKAMILPEIAYDRAGIGNREGRVRLTQEILRAFEPAIRQHVTQWYHFVPIWRNNSES
jgi:lauroyl/myristoyl acyltransferase